jgi:hypothetical protein
MSQGDVIGGAAVPLTEALPWTPPFPSRTLLLNDSIGSDGRFLMHTLASQILSTPSATGSNNKARIKRGRVLWLGCGPVSEAQIFQSLKKIGCEKTELSQALLWSNQSGADEKNDRAAPKTALTIRSLVAEICSQIENPEVFLKQIYQYIQNWLLPSSDSGDEDDAPKWIILDDVSSLGNLLGERLVYSFLLALNAKSHEISISYGLMIRCSIDSEEKSLPTFVGSSVATGPDWFGSGGLGQRNNAANLLDFQVPWERSLIELADGVMDVLPLTSGYTRELHGRIIFSQLPGGRGWGSDKDDRKSRQSKQKSSPMQTINYCITDSKIVAYIL